MVLSGNNPAYFVKRAEWDSLYAKQGGEDLSALNLKLPPAIGLERNIGENQTEQIGTMVSRPVPLGGHTTLKLAVLKA